MSAELDKERLESARAWVEAEFVHSGTAHEDEIYETLLAVLALHGKSLTLERYCKTHDCCIRCGDILEVPLPRCLDCNESCNGCGRDGACSMDCEFYWVPK